MGYEKIKSYFGNAKYKFAHEKKDGYWSQLVKHPDGTVEVFLRKMDKNIWPQIEKITHIKKAVNNLPNNSVLNCELYAPGMPASSVITLINSSSAKLQMCPFGAEKLSGWRDLGNPNISLPQFNEAIKKYGFDAAELIAIACRTQKELLAMAVVRRYEGWVLKNSLFDCWTKLKPERTVDAVVVSVSISDSETMRGAMKAIQVAVYAHGQLKIIASVGSGFDYEFKRTVNPESLIGRVAEIKYDCLCAKGKLRFPTFIRWRDDEKTPNECKIEQLKVA